MDNGLKIPDLQSDPTDGELKGLLSRLYAWVRSTGKYQAGGWACAEAHYRLVELLQTLELEYTFKGRAIWFTLLDISGEPLDFWAVKGSSFFEEFFVIKNLTPCKSSIQLKSTDDKLAFMLLADVEGYAYESTNERIIAVYKK